MKILVACEESQTVTVEFRNRGHEAYSCDILSPSGNHPEWHIQDDVKNVAEKDWDMIVAFPPCTHLASSGARWFSAKQKDGRQLQGIDFFLYFTQLDCPKIAIENPVGIMSSKYRKPDQIIQPYQFGDSYQKTTCLWLKNLPKLIPTNIVSKGDFVLTKAGKKKPKWYADSFSLSSSERSKVRSKTFPGIAKAMASQWY